MKKWKMRSRTSYSREQNFLFICLFLYRIVLLLNLCANPGKYLRILPSQRKNAFPFFHTQLAQIRLRCINALKSLSSLGICCALGGQTGTGLQSAALTKPSRAYRPWELLLNKQSFSSLQLYSLFGHH